MRDARAQEGSRVKLVALGFGTALALACAGCTSYKVDQRIAYWRTEMAQGLPLGATQAEAQAFFTARGATLTCCVSGPPGADKYHLVHERKVGQGIVMEYDVAVLVDISPQGRVRGTRVERWGIGF